MFDTEERRRATKSKSFLRYSICAFASYEFNSSAACPSPWRSFVNSNPPNCPNPTFTPSSFFRKPLNGASESRERGRNGAEAPFCNRLVPEAEVGILFPLQGLVYGEGGRESRALAPGIYTSHFGHGSKVQIPLPQFTQPGDPF